MSKEKEKVSRRKFITYTAAGAVVVAGAAAGVYYATLPPTPGPSPTTTAATATAPPTTLAPRELIVGGQWMTRLMDAQKSVTGHDVIVLRHVYDTLITHRHPNYNTYLPSLAKSWEISEDAKVYTFHLRDDVKFYPSGNPMTADDVIWSFDRALKGQFPGGKSYAYVKEVRKVDNYTVQVELKTPFVAYLALLAGLYDGVIMDSKAVIPHVNGAWGTPECDWGSPWIDEHSVGTGPYYIKEWSRSVRVVLERNPYYWGPKPANDRIIFQIVAEPAALQMMLERGDVDIAQIGMPMDSIMDYIDHPKPDIKVAEVPTFACYVSHMSTAFPPFADAKVREAMRYAINYPEIREKMMRGKAIQMSSPLYKGLLGGGKIYYEYDLEKAKRLMSESKYPNGFEVTKIVPSAADLGVPYRDVVLKETEDLAKIGIKVKMEEYDWSVLDERIPTGKFDYAQDMHTIIFVDPEGMYMLSGAPRHGESLCLSKTPWRDEEIDSLLDEGLAETDPAKREQLYDQANKLIAERGVEVWYFQAEGLYPYRSDIKNYEPWTHFDMMDYSNVTRS